ncbi:MAG TPA: hypothetical protein VJ853_09145 [Thermoanaerobaculia bacterium]|nr:hypothetical protein [Thermoanaerobaculia bacterium]
MKRLVTISALVVALGCASVQNGDRLRNAALQAIGAERVAWLTNRTAPVGTDIVDLKNVTAYVNSVDPNKGIATITYEYTGRFSTPEGQRDGTLTVQRRVHFTKSDSGTWTPNGQMEEVARNSSWSSERAAS